MDIITKMSDETQSPKLAIWHSSNYTLELYRLGQVDSYYNLHLQNNNAYNRNFLPYIRGGLGNTTYVECTSGTAACAPILIHSTCRLYLPTYHQEPIPNSRGILNRSHSGWWKYFCLKFLCHILWMIMRNNPAQADLLTIWPCIPPLYKTSVLHRHCLALSTLLISHKFYRSV